MNNNNTPRLTRRTMLAGTGVAALATTVDGSKQTRSSQTEVPVRVITQGPQHHWFGYYDKFEFDPTDRYVLSMETDFEHRSPQDDDEIRIGMIDLHDNDRWIELGTTSAWCWQQGCMLQWIPESSAKLIWNDRQDDHFNCHIMDAKTREKRTLPHPVYTVSADGATGVAPDFRRIQDVRPGYGYPGFDDPFKDDLAPRDTGIFRIDLTSGQFELIISLEDIAAMGTIPRAEPGIKHYFNHLLFNPTNDRFIFLHRWRYPNGRRLSRMMTANSNGSDVHIVDDNGLTSHFIWRDEKHILAWSNPQDRGPAFYLFEDRSDKVEVVGRKAMPADGHCNYLPGGEWVVNDTYPDKNRHQEVYLYHPGRNQRISLGKFLSPTAYTGEWRCDTHPRVSRRGGMLVIDSPHLDQGRQLHLLEIDAITS